MTRIFWACASIIAVATASAAPAQDMGGAFISSGIGNAGIEAATQSVEDVVADPTIIGTPIASADLSFAPSRSRTAQNLRSFVTKTRAKDRSAATDLETLFAAQPDIIDLIGGEMRNLGLDPHNVADAYALWWMSAWLAANQRHDTPGSGTIASVREQARAALAATADFGRMDAANRQQFAEALMIQTALTDAAMEQAKGQPDVLSKLAQAAKQGALASGLDLNAMVLTENGFVPREGADASGAVGEDAPALAQAKEASTATVVAIAAALGLGLGGAFWLGKRSG